MGRGRVRCQRALSVCRHAGVRIDVLLRIATQMALEIDPGVGQRAPRIGVVRVEIKHLLIKSDALPHAGVGDLAAKRSPLQHQTVGFDIVAGSLVVDAEGLAEQLDLQCARHGLADFRLDGEHILQLIVMDMRPQHAAAVRGADHPDGDADAIALLVHGTLDQVGHAQCSADLRRAVRGIAELEAGVLADHLEFVDLGKVGDQLFGQAVGEVLLFRITALVGERQHRDRFFRQLGEYRGGVPGSGAVRGAGGVSTQHELVGHQQHHGQRENRDDPEVRVAGGVRRDRLGRVNLALAPEAGRGELVAPRERELEREADDGRDQKPASRPVGEPQRRTELRQTLPERPHGEDIHRPRAQHVAAFQFANKRPCIHVLGLSAGSAGPQ